MDDITRREILGEALMDEFKLIREYLEYLLPVPQKLVAMQQDIDDLKSDMKIIKITLQEHGRWMKNHELHHAHLEAALSRRGIL